MPPGSRKGSAMVNSASLLSNSHRGQHHPPFVPDYTVKAVSDVIYLRIKRPMYCAALKASKMANNPKADGTENEHVLDRYLERVNEDEDNPDILVIGTPRAETRSLHTIPRTGQTSKNGSAMRLADREEEGEFWGESRSTVRADSIGTEVRDVSRTAANAGSSSNGPASLPMGANGDGGGGGSSTALLDKEGSGAVVAEGGGGGDGEHGVDGGGQAEGR